MHPIATGIISFTIVYSAISFILKMTQHQYREIIILNPSLSLSKEMLSTVEKNKGNDQFHEHAKEVRISRFQLVKPSDIAHCKKSDPWIAGKNVIQPDESLVYEGCFAIELTIDRDSHIILLSEIDNHHIIQLIPNRCQKNASDSIALGHRAAHFPKTEKQNLGVYLVEQDEGSQTIFLVAIELGYENKSYQTLFKQFEDNCTAQKLTTDAIDLKLELNRLKSLAPGKLDWSSRRFYY